MGVRLSVRPREGGSGDEAVYEFDQDRILVGRGAGADVVLPDRSVSVRHATIELRQGGYCILDHGSTNGTRVNGALLVPERPKPLRDGDRIDLGVFVLTWKEAVPVASSPTAERTAALARRLLRAVLADAAPARPRLLVTNGPGVGAVLEIPPPPARLMIGRAHTCDLALADADVSREHVELFVDLDGVLARDRGSKNGLIVNGRRVEQKRLADRDELLVGATMLVYEDPAELAARLAADGDDVPMPEPVCDGLEPARTAAPAEPDAAPAEPDAAPARRGPPQAPVREPSGPRAARPRIGRAELLVYALASLVTLASVVGLWWLWQAE